MNKNLMPTIVLCLWLLVIITIGFISTHSRMIADDYCTAFVGIDKTPLGAVQYYYTAWTGRYSDIFVKSALAPLQPNIHSWQFPMFLIIWALLLRWVLGIVLKALQIYQYQWAAISLTILLLFVTLGNTGGQSLYWFAALIPYVVPMLPITLIASGLLWLLFNNPSFMWRCLIVIGIALCIGITAGFTETYAAMQITGIVLLLFLVGYHLFQTPKQVSAAFSPKQWFIILGSLLIVALVSLLVVALAPGNFVRLSQQDASGVGVGILPLITNLFVVMVLMFVGEGNALAFFLFTFFAVIVGLFWWYSAARQQDLAALPYPKRPVRVALLVGLGVFLLVGAIITPPLYATSHVPSRIIFPARFAQFCLFAFWGYLAALTLAKYRFRERFARKLSYRLITWVLIGLMIFMPLNVLFQHVDILQNVPRYATGWDARHEMILAAAARGETRIEVPPLAYNFEDYLQLEKIEPEADANWVNGCASSYYGIDVFVAEEK